MRVFILLFLSFILICCEGKKTNTIKPKKNDSTSVIEKSILDKKEPNFLLNDSNVMEFFLDYDQKHKEDNRVLYPWCIPKGNTIVFSRKPSSRHVGKGMINTIKPG